VVAEVTTAILVVLMTVAVTHERHDQRQRACVNNLKNIGLGMRVAIPDTVTYDLHFDAQSKMASRVNWALECVD
jgi:hypothetical protein